MSSARAPGLSTVTVTAKQRVPSLVTRSTLRMSVTVPSKLFMRSGTETTAGIPS